MESSIYTLLAKQNPWWIKEKIDNSKAFLPKRSVYNDLQLLLEKERILALVGPRRTGKTVLLFQLIRYLLEEKKVKSQNIGYLLCDDPEIDLFLMENDFGKVIEGFLHKEEKIYLFLDEIQYIDKWALWLKKYHEFAPRIKFIISGSSALHLQKGSKESLLGRLIERTILPLTFDEYVRIKNTLSEKEKNIPKVIQKDCFSQADYFLSNQREFVARKEMLLPYFSEFLLRGGFPEGLSEDDISLWQEYLKEDVVKRQVYHDIVKIFKIENPSLLENLLVYIGSHPSELFSFESFLNALPFGSKETVVNYLTYLKVTFLVKSLSKYSKKALIKKKKYFLTDSGLANMIVKRKSLLGEDSFLGHLAESVVQNQCLNKNTNCFFYRDDKGHEVDLVVKKEKETIPIEVKYSPKVGINELAGLLYFLKNEKLEKGMVLTKDKIGKEKIKNKTIYYLPIWEFLYNG